MKRISIKLKLAAICIAYILNPSSAYATEGTLPLIDSPAYTQPQNMVRVEAGRRLNLYCIGEGSPTIVFESGQGVPIALWGRVQPVLARKVRTCSYDRAGIGFSDGTSRESTSANIVDDLHRLLVAADIRPPYVLVGHSLGGMFVRLYADYYPAEVVGMVLIDPAVEDQTESFRKVDLKHRNMEQWRAEIIEPDIKKAQKCVALATIGLVRGTDTFKECISEQFTDLSEAANSALQNNEAKPDHQQANLSETENQFTVSANQVRVSRHSYGDLPLTVLTRGKWSAPKESATPEELANREARILTWNRLHVEVAKLSRCGTNTIVEGARHFIMLDKPQAVIDAIEKIILLAPGNSGN